MRGAVVEHPKYKGRRVFGAGINLTHLYHGRIPFVWYLQRDLGYVNKLYRGLALADDAPPDEFGGRTIEKPWIAAVEAFAIGGHCQVSAGDGLRAGRAQRVPDACRRARKASSRAPPTCGCRASPATASRARRSSTSGGSNATARRGG